VFLLLCFEKFEVGGEAGRASRSLYVRRALGGLKGSVGRVEEGDDVLITCLQSCL